MGEKYTILTKTHHNLWNEHQWLSPNVLKFMQIRQTLSLERFKACANRVVTSYCVFLFFADPAKFRARNCFLPSSLSELMKFITEADFLLWPHFCHALAELWSQHFCLVLAEMLWLFWGVPELITKSPGFVPCANCSFSDSQLAIVGWCWTTICHN